MKEIKVLGIGCANCKSTIALIEQIAQAKGVEVNSRRSRNSRHHGLGIMATPGVVIDGKVVHAGGVPSREKVASWF